MNITEKQSDLIKMENGKKELPQGMSRTKYDTYRIQRKVNGVRYQLPIVRNLELALGINEVFTRIAADYKEAVDGGQSVVSIHEADLHFNREFHELNGRLSLLESIIETQSELIDKQSNILRDFEVNVQAEPVKKTFWQRVMGR